MRYLDSHRTLLSDDVGQAAFRKAIQAVVQPGDVVLDVGTGTGIHAMFACQAGAERVYAVERDQGMALIARRVCSANGFKEKVTVFDGSLEEIEIGERVDVVIGHFGFGPMLEVMWQARERFLKPTGVLVPKAAAMFCAPMQSEDSYNRFAFWKRDHYDLRFDAVQSACGVLPSIVRIQQSELLGPGVCALRVEIGEYERARSSICQARTIVTKQGMLHGIGSWYVEELAAGIEISLEPPCTLPISVWPHMFCPLVAPTAVSVGDIVDVTVDIGSSQWVKRIDVVRSDGRSTMSWSDVNANGDVVSDADEDGSDKIGWSPQLRPFGVATLYTLACCDGSKTQNRIVRELQQHFSQLFRREDDARRFVVSLVNRYTC